VARPLGRGSVFVELKRYDEALASFELALARRPDYGWAHSCRGIVLHELGRYEEALASQERALALEPDSAITHSNRGVALYHLRRLDEVMASFERALTLQPDLAEAHFAESHYRLLTGDLALGWEKAEWRWQVEPLKSSNKRDIVQPQWTGSQEIAGKAPGDHVSLTVAHAGGTTGTVDVTLGAQPAQPPATHSNCGNS